MKMARKFRGLKILALNYPTLFDESFDINIEENHENTWLHSLKGDIDSYFQDLKTLSKIKELKVSKENIIYRNMFFQEEMRKYAEEGEQSNSFLSLIPKQTVLYGRGVISRSDNYPRQETILQTIGHSSYLPLVLSLDPHNHSQILKQYKEKKIARRFYNAFSFN